MAIDLSILYRGPLASCDYDCPYCPFAKHVDKAAALATDREQLARFVNWVETCCDNREADSETGLNSVSVLFTPWGEALIRRWYRDAIVRLSLQPHVKKVAVQTNLSFKPSWLSAGDLSKIGLWCTYHPGEVSREKFLSQCGQLDTLGVRYSVGVVGLREHFEEIAELRDSLREDVYLWINAFKDQPNYYTPDDIAFCEAIDPLFSTNNTRHPSLGRPCRAGSTAISVDGEGTVRRCHFIQSPLGNLYTDPLRKILSANDTHCTNATCGCHIGYVHMPELDLYNTFAGGVLERIPAEPIWQITRA